MQPTLSLELNNAQFGHIKHMLHEICGIDLHPGKQGLVKSRLQKRLRLLKLANFDDYLHYVKSEQAELSIMVDALTTNKTSFFRESNHFDFLKDEVFPKYNTHALRLWSAACSSGEEPYSLAILLRECLAPSDQNNAKILATDISRTVLQKAREGIYSRDLLETVPGGWRHKYVTPQGNAPVQSYQMRESIQSMVRFAWLNLMGPWPMKKQFDIIFCRNVMIYFNKTTRQNLVRRFCDCLKPGGYLFVGHSESLMGISGDLEYVRPAIYTKP